MSDRMRRSGFPGACLRGLLLAGSLSGCARLDSAGPLRLWDIPPGAPTVHEPSSDTFLPPEVPKEAADQSGRKWSRPDRMLSAAMSPRRVAHEDPFLGWRSTAAGNTGQATPIIQLPENRFAGNGLTAFDPRSAFRLGSGAPHQKGDLIPFADEFASQLERLQFALDFDTRSASGARLDRRAADAVRSRVKHLLALARKDMDEGRLAAAHTAAQQAESLAGESGIEFSDGEETPAQLVQTLRTRINTDATEQHDLPPEESVESTASALPPAPDFTPPRDEFVPASGSGPTPVPGDTPRPGAGVKPEGPQLTLPALPAETPPATSVVALEPTPREPAPASAESGSTEPPVEFLPPAPTTGDDDSHLEEIPAEANPPRRPRHPPRVATLAEVVGPASPLGPSLGSTADNNLVPDPSSGPADEATAFWPGRRSDPPGPAIAETPAQPETADHPDHSIPASLAASNVRWGESPEPVVRPRPADRIPRPWLAGIGGVALGIVALGGIRWLRSAPRPRA